MKRFDHLVYTAIGRIAVFEVIKEYELKGYELITVGIFRQSLFSANERYEIFMKKPIVADLDVQSNDPGYVHPVHP